MNEMNSREANRTEALELRIRRLEALIQQLPSRPVNPVSLVPSLRSTVTQVAHGFGVGDVVYGRWDGTELVYELGWGFSGLEYAVDGVASVGAFGVVSQVASVDRFELTTAGWVPSLRTLTAEASLTDDDRGIDLYLAEEVDEPGAVTRFRTASGIRIGSYLGAPAGHSAITIFRDSSATFSLATLDIATLTIPAGEVAVVDVSVVPPVLAEYTDDPDPKDLCLAWCKFSATQTVLVVHGKVWRGEFYGGSGGIPRGPCWLSNAGALSFPSASHVDAWTWDLIGVPLRNAPKIRLGYLDGASGFFFDPCSEVGLFAAWDLCEGPAGPLANGDVIVWDSTNSRWRWRQPASGLTAFAGPGVLGVPTGASALPSAIGPGTNGDVLRVTAGALGFGKIVAANITANVIGATELAQALAYTVVGNGTSATANAVGITASADGTVLNRKGTTLAFVATMELGTTGSGGGTFKCNFAAGKYFSIDASGNVDLFHSASVRVQINTLGKITITYGSSNTIIFDATDIVGSSRAFKIREMDVCDAFGVAKKIQLLCTDMY